MSDLLDQLPPGIDERWLSHGATVEFFEENARWLKEARHLHSSSRRFFEVSGTLLRLARLDYLLASVAFFQAIPGLERALKLHYGKEEDGLRDLLTRAVNDGLIHDALFADIPPLTERFVEQFNEDFPDAVKTHTEKLLFLIPELRNQYFHGTYLLAPDYLHLTIQLRQIADVLTTKRQKR